MMQRMSALEETYWMQYHQMSPIGEQRADIRSAQLAHLIYNVNASKKSQKKTLIDFLPFYRKHVKEPDPEQLDRSVRSFFSQIAQQKGNK